MKTLFTFLFLLTFVFQNDGYSQRHPPPDQGRRMPERVEKFQTMRLIEILKLSEEDAARFTAKKRVHDENLGDLMKVRNETIDDLEDIVKDKGRDADIQKKVDQVLEIDQKVFTERQRFQEEMRTFLNAEQFAKFIVFERNFGRRVRDAVGEMYDRRRERGRE